MNVAVVIPAYNEAKTIRTIAERVLTHIDKVIVIDDGSTDETISELAGLPITVLRHARNQGKANSLLRGFAAAQSFDVDAILTLDADTQHNPDDIPKFLSEMKAHPNHLIIGARQLNTEHAPALRRNANRIADFFLSWAAGQRIVDSQSGYRLYPNSLVKHCLSTLNNKPHFVFESEVLIDGARTNLDIINVPIASHYPENARKSHYRPIVDTSRITAMIGKNLILNRMNLPGFYRAFIKRK